MKTREEIIENCKANLAKFDKEETIRAELPEEIRETASICIHRDHASVTAWNGYQTTKHLFDAARIVSAMAPTIVEGEHWKDGSISTNPASINTNAKRESATMDGSHAVEILVEGGKGYGPNVTVCFWTQLPSGLVEMHVPVGDLWKLVPSVRASYDRSGYLENCKIEWPTESRCVDSFRTWWSEKPSYRGSYYLADLPNFEAWTSSVQKVGA